MADIVRVLTILQMALGVLLVLSILLQQKSSGLAESLGGSQALYTTRRGPEKVLFYATILFSVAFFGVSVASMILAV